MSATFSSPRPSRVDPIRQEGPLFGARRESVRAECDRLTSSIRALERQLDELAAERRRLARSLKQNRRRLWPNLAKRGRRPAPDGTEQLPPVRHDASFLWGRRLRALCRSLLKASGPLTLTDLHALLHHHNAAIASSHPVKALADAMGYEVDQGRVRRVARGVYRLAG